MTYKELFLQDRVFGAYICGVDIDGKSCLVDYGKMDAWNDLQTALALMDLKDEDSLEIWDKVQLLLLDYGEKIIHTVATLPEIKIEL